MLLELDDKSKTCKLGNNAGGMELCTVKCRTVASSRENHSFVPLGEKVQSRASLFQPPLLRFLPIVATAEWISL